ncbi:MAG: hypothetical protein MRY74_16960 [Neomegalonema sp.]|nr:hypothetical protein [Neomegalonema sp.]
MSRRRNPDARAARGGERSKRAQRAARAEFAGRRFNFSIRRFALGRLGLALIAIGAMSAAAAYHVGSSLGLNRDWAPRLVLRSQPTGAEDLFRRMVAEKAIQLDLAKMRINVRPLDCADRRAVARAKAEREERDPDAVAGDPLLARCGGDDPKSIDELTVRFYKTPAGRSVLDHIDRWNASFSILAVRDDRAANTPCEDPESFSPASTTSEPTSYVAPRGCWPSKWRAAITAPGFSDVDITDRRAGDPSPAVYGFLAGLFRPGFGDWRSISLARLPNATGGEEPTISLTTKFEGRRRTVRVDIVGQIDRVAYKGRVATIAQVKKTQNFPGLRVQRLCASRSRLSSVVCDISKLDKLAPFATRLTFSAASGDVKIILKPAQRLPKRFQAVARSRACPAVYPFRTTPVGDIYTEEKLKVAAAADPEAEAKKTRALELKTLRSCGASAPDALGLAFSDRVTERLGLRCYDRIVDEVSGATRIGPSARCFVTWTSAAGRRRPSPPQYRILDRDGAVLASRLIPDSDGPKSAAAPTKKKAAAASDEPTERKSAFILNPEVVKLGLAAIVGHEHDPLSLAGQMLSKSKPERITDVSLTIDRAIQARAMQTVRELAKRRDWAKRLAGRVPKAGDNRRRIVIVVMDAEKAPGEILAAAMWPGFDRFVGDPKKIGRISAWDLLAFDAWSPADSPFATIAWSANDALMTPGSSFKPLVAVAGAQAALKGDANLEALLAGVGSTAELRRLTGISFGDGAMRPIPGRPSVTIANFANSPTGRAFLPTAVTGCPARHTRQLGVCEAIGKSTNTYFARMAQLVGREAFLAAIDRLYPVKASARVALIEEDKLKLSRGSRLHATPLALDISRAKELRLNAPHVLALNGIGQSVQATPLSIVTAYTQIKVGYKVRPRLSLGTKPAPPTPILDGPAEQVKEHLDRIRAGLRFVVKGPGSTASAPFAVGAAAPFRAGMHGKTGTAQVADNGRAGRGGLALKWSVWFAGFYDAPPGGKGLLKGDVAFVCMVSHGGDSATGGGVCAPAIRQMMIRLTSGKR